MANYTNQAGNKSVQFVQDVNGNITGTFNPSGPNSPVLRAARPSNYPHARKALANVRNGNGNCKIAMIGDSTMLGRAAATSGSYTGARPYNQPAQLCKILTAAGLTANNNSLFGSGTVLSNLAAIEAYDTRLSGSGSGLSTTGSFCMGANSFTGSSAFTLSFTPTTALTNYEVYYVDSGTGSFGIQIGSGSTTTVTSAGSGNQLKATISAAASTSPLNISWISGTVYVFGFRGWNSAVSECSVVTMGWAGGGVTNWSLNTPATRCPISSLELFAPDLTVIRAGINDWVTSTSTPASTFVTDLTAVVAAAQVSGDVLIETSPYGSLTSATPATQAQMNALVQAMEQVSAATGCDFNNNAIRWGSEAFMNTLGYYDTDQLHYVGLGYADIAKSTADYILSM